MSDFTFEDAEVPAIGVGRKALPNPFTDAIALLDNKRKTNPKAALSFTLTAKTAAELDESIAKVRRDLTRGGNAANVTVRFKAEKAEKGNSALIRFWVTDKILKPRKDETTA